MNKQTINQVCGFVIIMMVILLNFVLAVKCMEVGSCDMLNTYGWGFMNGMLVVTGMFMLGG